MVVVLIVRFRGYLERGLLCLSNGTYTGDACPFYSSRKFKMLALRDSNSMEFAIYQLGGSDLHAPLPTRMSSTLQSLKSVDAELSLSLWAYP